MWGSSAERSGQQARRADDVALLAADRPRPARRRLRLQQRALVLRPDRCPPLVFELQRTVAVHGVLSACRPPIVGPCSFDALPGRLPSASPHRQPLWSAEQQLKERSSRRNCRCGPSLPSTCSRRPAEWDRQGRSWQAGGGARALCAAQALAGPDVNGTSRTQARHAAVSQAFCVEGLDGLRRREYASCVSSSTGGMAFTRQEPLNLTPYRRMSCTSHVRRYYADVITINNLEPDMRALSNPQLRCKTGQPRRRAASQTAYVAIVWKSSSPTAASRLSQPSAAEFKARLAAGAELESLRCEAFAVVREASRRVLGMRHYDCQLVSALWRRGRGAGGPREERMLRAPLPLPPLGFSGKAWRSLLCALRLACSGSL